MSSLSQFTGGSRPPKVLVNQFSTTGFSVPTGSRPDVQAAYVSAKQVNSGALTAATLATILSVTGAGVIDFLSVWSQDATSRTIRVQVTIDGNVIFDSTSAAFATTLTGFTPIGGGGNGNSWGLLEPLSFNQSLLIRVASSLSETDKVALGYKYWTT